MKAWLHLIRLPNILTVPGDPLAGFYIAAVASGTAGITIGSTGFVIFSVIALYSAGMIMNDLVDVDEDRKNHLARPLITGEISIRMATAATVILLILGGLAAFKSSFLCGCISLILIASIICYNLWAKKYALFGAFVMGLCRALSLVLGAALIGFEELFKAPVILSASGLLLYIVGVTLIAHREQKTVELGTLRFIPFIALFTTLSFHVQTLDKVSYYFAGLAIASIATAFKWGHKLTGEVGYQHVGPAVGGLIANLILFQAALISIYSDIGLLSAGIALLFLNGGKILRKSFYAT